jgi:predicted DNA-binding transcriptional regulator AlpA
MIEGTMTRKEVKDLFGISEATLCVWVKKGKLPPPIAIGRNSFWFRDVIDQVVEGMKAAQFAAVRSGAQRRSGALPRL